MQDKIDKVLTTVVNRVTPKASERARISDLADKLEKKVASTAKRLGFKTTVRLEGSMAKNTWLSSECDVDIFMRVPTAIPRKSLGEICLRIARKATEGSEQIERFAEHPYLETFIDDVRVNIVPCYDAKPGRWLSATDRTPFHTDYVNGHFDEQLRGEVRILKKFMKGIGVYGAEIKVGGFSGYLCELLVLHYRSFVNTLKAFAVGKQRIVVDIENYYDGRENELRLLFNESLVIVDPVDKGRNVASAVQTDKLHIFVAAARAFLETPSIYFFYPKAASALSLRELKAKLTRRGSAIVFAVFGRVEAVPDVLWGQLYRSKRSLRKLIVLSDFGLLRDFVWSDEKGLNVFAFELEQRGIPPVKKHLGPPLERELECHDFLRKYRSGSSAVVGPYVEDGRWVVQIRRKHIDAGSLLSEKLRDGGRNAGVADRISHVLKQGFNVYVDGEIAEVYSENREFAVFLTYFLSGKPRWLETA
jgi:tRNA nucleotidyltransferase (CCA-adding enzyme)